MPRLPGVPEGFLASQLPDSGVELADGFLNLFGRPPRKSACECERSTGVMLGQALNLVNGPTIAEAISDPANRITSLVATQPDDTKLVEELFVAILDRFPQPAESTAGVAAINAAKEEYNNLQAKLDTLAREQLPTRQAAWEKQQQPVMWTPLAVASAVSAGAQRSRRRPMERSRRRARVPKRISTRSWAQRSSPALRRSASKRWPIPVCPPADRDARQWKLRAWQCSRHRGARG